MIAANSFYNSIKADGLTLGAVNRGIVFGQLLKADGVRYDVTKYSWIGSAASEPYVFWIRSDLPLNLGREWCILPQTIA